MCSQPDYEFGTRLYGEAVATGNLNDERGATIYAYGLYLMGGGTPEGFMDLTPYDAQVLIATADGIRVRERNELLKGICRMFGGEVEE